MRLVFSRSGKLPAEAHVLTDAEAARTRVIAEPQLKHALQALYRDGISNILLEGGPNLSAEFLKAGLVQRVSHYLNPSYLGEGLSALNPYDLQDLHQRLTLKHVEYTVLKDDLVLSGRL